MTAYEQLNAKIFNSSIENYINKIILVSKTGEFIIQGKSYGINKDVEICRNLPYFDALLNASDYEWIGLQPELFSSSRPGTSSLPIIRPLINSSTGAINGWLYIALDPSFVAGKLTSHPQAFDSTYYWMIENKAYRYDNGNFVETHLCIQDASPSDTSSLLYLTENEDNKKALCISLNRPVFCSSAHKEHPGKNVTDGSFNTFWYPAEEETGGWILVDLEGTKEVKSITLEFNAVMNGVYELALSDDRKEFRQIYLAREGDANSFLTVHLSSERARFVRARFPGEAVGIVKIEVMA